MARIEQGEVSALEAIEALLDEEFTTRESRRIKMALQNARLTTVKTLSGYDFSFQPSLDRHRGLALAQLEFVERKQCVHLLGPPGTGKSCLAIAPGVKAVRAGKSVYMATLADRVRFLSRYSLLIVVEIGYLSVGSGGGNLFFQLVNACYERRDDHDGQPRLRRVGRDLRRRCRGHRAAGSAAAPRGGHPHRGQLSPANRRRRRAGG